jgi:asparagine synthase (glutamine-hydrolysing)
MCGIAGLVCLDGRQPAAEQLKAMMDIIEHRGPDDEGIFIEPGVGLGFRRLSIIDLSEGHQPLSNEDGNLWITFNGEIYNYRELREMLIGRGHEFKTHSDTEVIVHLFEEYGENCVDHLRGMFGFVIWDRKRKQLFGARDHFGIKPFYYLKTADTFYYGSEMKSLLKAEGTSRSVRPESLMNYLTFQYVPEPNTMFDGIMKLPPAHAFTLTLDGTMNIRKYWDPMFAPVERPIGHYIEEVREKLQESVKAHMVSDVQRGCFLSSGIDSTAIAAQMRKIEPIKTFSVGFDGPNNETIIARETAKALGTDHYEKIITKDDFFGALPKAAWHQDEPVADPSAIALYHVAQLAREQVTVVLSGEGADELFGGYRIYREPGSLKALSWLPSPMKKALHSVADALPTSTYGRNYLLRATTPLEQRFLGNARLFTEDAKQQLMNSKYKELLNTYEHPVQIAEQFYNRTKHLDDVSRMQYIDLNLWMPGDILMKADKMTMAHSLELRVPFLDKELFELTRQIPVQYRIANGTTKYVFRKAMEGVVPDFILNRPKLGFPVPLRTWMKEAEGDRILEQIAAAGLEDYINIDHVRDMLLKHRAGQGDYARKIWVLYMFALWHDTYVKG